MHRPAHLRASFLGLAFLGGIGGTAARESISLAVPAVNGIPVAIFAINVLGAFLLGLLLEALARRGPDEGARRTIRILIGTGFMGGFTTYSALATDAAQLMGHGAVGAGIGYGLATVLLGGLATWAGIAVGAATHRTTGTTRQPVDPDLAEATVKHVPVGPDPAGAAPETEAPEAAPEPRNGGVR